MRLLRRRQQIMGDEGESVVALVRDPSRSAQGGASSERSLHVSQDRFVAEWLREKALRAGAQTLDLGAGIGMRRHDDHRQRGIDIMQSLAERVAFQVRHLEIGEHQVRRLAARLEQRVLTARRRRDDEPFRAQEPLERDTRARVVVDEQNASVRSHSPATPARSAPLPRRPFEGARIA